jgi:hypothetical protein
VLFALGWLAFAYVLLPEAIMDSPDDPVTGGELLRVVSATLAIIVGGVMAVLTWRSS